mmetsp:Transcript_27482/g.64165  ORF Transcript_27482/g.64165 Transcript_27482/m.64165 type:complete len:196 (+) Transcript_27482:275-862(+)
MQREPKQIQEVARDGNCLFHSVAHQIYGVLETDVHQVLRADVVRYMSENRAHFSLYVDGDFDEYLRSRTHDGVWGDNLEIVALAEIFDRPVEVWSREAPVPSSGIMQPQRVVQEVLASRHIQPIRLTYHGGSHYNSLVNPDDPPPLGELKTSHIRDARTKNMTPATPATPAGGTPTPERSRKATIQLNRERSRES